MSSTDTRRYQPVSVEDWDEEAQASIPGTRTTANVAVKRDLTSDPEFQSTLVRFDYDGTDSGYASKAPTVSSMASSKHRRNSELKVDTAVVTERERKPYAMTAGPRDSDRQPATRQTKEKESKEAPKPVKKPFCHKEGICWVCDKYGFHFDPKDPPKELLDKKVTKAVTPAAQPVTQPPKTATPKPKPEEQVRPPSRRMSSNQARPTSMYAAHPVQVPYAQYPAMHHGWNTVAPPPPGIAFTQYPYAPTSTPVSYLPPQQFYFEPPSVFEDYSHPAPPPPPPKIIRRLSMASQERPPLEKKPSRTNTVVERPVSREARPQLISHKSTKSIDADKLAMPPPPPKPKHVTAVNSARPRPGRSNTYHSNGSYNRRSKYEESDDDDDDEEDEIYLDPRALVTYRDQPISPRRPPSSYRPPVVQEIPERPQLAQKARSYQDGSSTTLVATTPRAESMPRRRTTESSTRLEQTEANAEAYIRKRGSLPLVDLTAENLKTLKNAGVPKHVSDQRSESGSTASHVTHHSSSKDSSNGRGRTAGSALGHSKGASMNININGLNFNITDDGNQRGEGPPVKLDLGGIQISMNNRDKENIDYRPKPGQKQIERAPSVSSRPSRRSLTMGGGSLVSAATSGQRREKDEILAIEAAHAQREYVRRDSYIDEEEREAFRRASAKSSRQGSRNTSGVRQPADELPTRPRIQAHRSSVDFSMRDESIM